MLFSYIVKKENHNEMIISFVSLALPVNRNFSHSALCVEVDTKFADYGECAIVIKRILKSILSGGVHRTHN